MKSNSAFTNDIQFSPYWWDASPPPTLPSAELPQSVDVAVVGSGYTGLHAALVTARAGRSTIILEAHEPGYGCSTRNGGQISTSIKPGLAELTKRYGQSTAENIVHDGRRSLDWIEQFVTEEKLDCHFKRCGRFHAAHNTREFNQLVAAMESQPVGFEVPVQIVPKYEQHSELATDAYHGGVVFERHASLDPGRYHTQLLQRVLQADVNVQAHCKVGKIKNHNGYFLVDTPRGVLKARDVIIATNGYTSSSYFPRDTPYF